MMGPRHIGDGVYVEDDGYYLRLYTQTDNAVYLDDGCIVQLLRYIKEREAKRCSTDASSSEQLQD